MRSMKLIFLVIILLSVSGCSSFHKLNIINKTVDRNTLDLEKTQTPLDLSTIKFEIITYNDFVYISLKPQEYEKLSMNNQKILNKIKEQRIIIQAYKEYYEREK